MYTNIDEFCECYGFCKYSECSKTDDAKPRFLRLVLNSTDYVVIRGTETGLPLPENFVSIRQQIRDEINRLENLELSREEQDDDEDEIENIVQIISTQQEKE